MNQNNLGSSRTIFNVTREPRHSKNTKIQKNSVEMRQNSQNRGSILVPINFVFKVTHFM